MSEKEKGFTIVELIITLVFVSFALLGIYAFFHPASVLSANFSNHLIAMRLGQEGVEVIKNIRDNNIRNGRSWLGLPDLGACRDSRGCQLTYKSDTPGQTESDRLKLYDDNRYLKVNEDGFYDYDTRGTASVFKRKVAITTISSDAVRIEVTVAWNYNNKTLVFKTIGYMYNFSF